MKAAYVLSMLFLRLWLVGFFLFSLWAVSECVFGNHSFKQFFKRMQFVFIWPLAAFSRSGRQYLLGKLKEL